MMVRKGNAMKRKIRVIIDRNTSFGFGKDKDLYVVVNSLFISRMRMAINRNRERNVTRIQ